MGLGYQDAKAVSARECRQRIGSGLRQSIIVAAIPGCAAKLRFGTCKCVYIYIYIHICIHMYPRSSLQECCKHGAA